MSVATVDKTIEVNDVCAVEHLSIPIPEGGGVVVLRGANGTGKSSTLRAVERLATGNKNISLTARDGVARGEISGCGVTLRVSRSITRTGELECESLDGKLSVAELVDPGLKGESEADAKRIRALVQLAGVKPDVSLFSMLLDNPAEFEEIVKGKDLKTDDVLVLADKIKRAIEEAARKSEGVANVEKSKAAACREASAGINTNVETDDGILHGMLEDAIRRQQDLTSKSNEANRRNAEILEARQKIVAATTPKSGEQFVSVGEARQRETYSHNSYSDASAKVEQLERDLQSARHEMERCLDRWEEAKRDQGRVERFHETIAELESVVSAGELTGPTEQELSESSDAVENCRASIDLGVLARRAIEQLEKSKKHATAESDALSKAESLREAAKRVDDVLSEQIASLGVALQVKAGRLVTNTRRGSTLYADLSEGERWKIALDIAIEAVGPEGMLYIPQPAYEALDPENRQLIIDRVTGQGVVILTAEATDGPLRAEVEPSTAA